MNIKGRFSILLFIFLSFSKMALANCQPMEIDYSFIAAANGTMAKKVSCTGNSITLFSHILVDVFIYKVTYDELSIGQVSKNSGIIPRSYTVTDSRESKPEKTIFKSKQSDVNSAAYSLSYKLQHKISLPKSLLLLKDKEFSKFTVTTLSKNTKIKTPLGMLNTAKIQLKNDRGDTFIFWFWKDKNYLMVREDVLEKGSSIFDATINKVIFN